MVVDNFFFFFACCRADKDNKERCESAKCVDSDGGGERAVSSIETLRGEQN